MHVLWGTRGLGVRSEPRGREVEGLNVDVPARTGPNLLDSFFGSCTSSLALYTNRLRNAFFLSLVSLRSTHANNCCFNLS